MENNAYVDWKISDVRRIKDKYGYRVTLIYGDGSSKVQQKSGFKTEKECKKARDIAFAKLYSGTYVVDEDIRLRDFLQKWLDGEIIKKKAATYDNFSRVAKLYIYPKLGNIRVSELTKGHLTAFYNEVCDHSYEQAKTCRIVLKLGLRYAVGKKLIAESPAENLLLPKREKEAKKPYHTLMIKEEQTLDAEQLKLLIEKSKDTKIYLFILFAALMGLRKSEIIGLKYSDIDYARQTIHVQRQLGKSYTFSSDEAKPKALTKQEITPKTRSSNRILDIPDIVFNAIMEQRKQYEANRRRRPKDFQDLDYIVCSSYGRPRSAAFVSGLYKELLRENGLPDIRFHDLRHTYATLLMKEDINIKAISKSLGHAKTIISVDVYGDKQKIIADGVDAVLPFIREVMPPEVLKELEGDMPSVKFTVETEICFPESLANDIMQDALHIIAATD